MSSFDLDDSMNGPGATSESPKCMGCWLEYLYLGGVVNQVKENYLLTSPWANSRLAKDFSFHALTSQSSRC